MTQQYVYVAMFGTCEHGGYNQDGGIISIHATEEGAAQAVLDYEANVDDPETDWAYFDKKELFA